MIRVVVEINWGTVRQRLVIQSSDIRTAMSVVEEHYLDGDEARVVFPIDPESFFVWDPDAVAGLIEIETIGEKPLEPDAGAPSEHGAGNMETPPIVVEEVVKSPPMKSYDGPDRSDHARSA